ncbi:TolC family protein [Nitrosovibrio sp. Nv6]|uniref:TolC family protein n=1 Tax=Nitrosovibrio sp. Nv6 TaxID=1855340 RepID=UPI0008AFA44B|nr:TolC family protein [Nitrosovibrio sp. Nv6]SEO81357.1 outer membrane protein, cobalt-zinc-cadmium efflux system [Nitrosovibrio sp. Nv6]
MNFDRLFMAPGYLAPCGWLVLALSWPSSAIAENSFAGAIPDREDRDMSFSMGSPLEARGDLTMKNAVRLALQHNPELAAFDKEIRALEGATLQAGLLRNPDLSVNVDNVGNMGISQRGGAPIGTSIKENVEQQDLIFRISQLIELGGKRSARVNAASLGQELAGKDFETKRLELIARVANTFMEVLAGQEQLRLAEESLQLAQSVVDTVKKRVQAGKVPPIEETKAGVAFSTTQIAQGQAQRELTAARKRLALLWGDTSPHFVKVLGNLESLTALPNFEALTEGVLASPMADRARKGIEHRKALLEVEQTRRVPNITIGGGMIKHWESGGTTGIVGLSMPLQFFDRNQGNVREAHQRVNKALDEQAATDLRLKTELVQAYETLSAVQNEITILRSEILPAAKSAFEVTNKGYELGKFGFLEVLDAQRTLFQNRVMYVRALANHHRLVNEIERLTAAPIDDIASASDDGPPDLQYKE